MAELMHRALVANAFRLDEGGEEFFQHRLIARSFLDDPQSRLTGRGPAPTPAPSIAYRRRMKFCALRIRNEDSADQP
jgi:hypothetical protein